MYHSVTRRKAIEASRGQGAVETWDGRFMGQEARGIISLDFRSNIPVYQMKTVFLPVQAYGRIH